MASDARHEPVQDQDRRRPIDQGRDARGVSAPSSGEAAVYVERLAGRGEKLGCLAQPKTRSLTVTLGPI